MACLVVEQIKLEVVTDDVVAGEAGDIPEGSCVRSR